jgi:hypothetical protein
MQLNPSLFEQERARVAARFENAVELAEQAFLDEFSKLVTRLCVRLASDSGEPKVFRDSAVDNLAEFFERFRSLNVRSNEQLEAPLSQAQRAVRGVEAQDLRDQQALRHRVAVQLGQVQSALDGLLVERPRRKIRRSTTTAGGA